VARLAGDAFAAAMERDTSTTKKTWESVRARWRSVLLQTGCAAAIPTNTHAAAASVAGTMTARRLAGGAAGACDALDPERRDGEDGERGERDEGEQTAARRKEGQ
jgi:hypothetical protein